MEHFGILGIFMISIAFSAILVFFIWFGTGWVKNKLVEIEIRRCTKR